MLRKLQNHIKNKKLIIFGTGELSEKITSEIDFINVDYYIDNNIEKQGGKFMGRDICSPQKLLLEEREGIFILVASSYYREMFQQLINMGFEEKKHFQNYNYFKYLGEKYYCSFCNEHFKEFLPIGYESEAFKNNFIIGGGYRENAVCPYCRSIDRERALYLYLKNKTNIFKEKLRVLHIAPEENLRIALSNNKKLEYICGDLIPKKEKQIIKSDITNLQYEDNYFDVVLCNHVLEHIENDKQAMKELYRVLKPKGWSILQVPISKSLIKTYEDFNIKSPQEKLEKFGQKDHVRIYGQDYLERLKDVGFDVNIYYIKNNYSIDIIRKFGLLEDEPIFICSKN